MPAATKSRAKNKKSRKGVQVVAAVAAVVAVVVIVVAMALLIPILGMNTLTAGKPMVQAEQISDTQIGITIKFPNDISGEFFGSIWGKHFDCQTPSSKVVYCIGPAASWMRSGVFYLYPTGSNSPVLKTLVTIAPTQQEHKQQEVDSSAARPTDNPAGSLLNDPESAPAAAPTKCVGEECPRR